MMGGVSKIRFAAVGSRHYAPLVAITSVVLVVSNIVATKGIEIGTGSLMFGPIQLWPLVIDGGALLFPLAYIVSDVVSEVYGFAAARMAIVIAFSLMILATLLFWVVQIIPGASWYENQAAYSAVVGPVAQIVVASLAAFVIGQLSNAWVVVRMKHGEGGLVSRLITSSGVGQSLDTIVFCALAATALGIDSFGVFANYVITGVLFKLGVEILALPITVRVIAAVKQAEPSYEAV